MKALLCKTIGGPDDLVVEEVSAPSLGPDEVRIEVHACGVNFPDVLMVQGKYQVKPELPFSPGLEVAGDIAEIGSAVEGFNVGDRVIAMTGFGGMREEIVVHAGRCLTMPDEMDYETAASFVLTYGTSYHALVDRGYLSSGEKVLVLGAAGGVGTAAIDIAHRLGAEVIAAGGSDDKLTQLKGLYGVSETINYNEEGPELRERVKAMTGGRGADVIYDPVGGTAFQQALRCVNWNGRILVVGFAADSENLPKAATNLLLLKGSSLIGVFWGRFSEIESDRNRANFDRLFQWYAAGELKPNISHRFPLAEGAEALKVLMRREVVGKCVVTLRN